jgi:two-component system CitB family sensor kinase
MQHALSQLGGEWYRTDRSEGTCMTIAIPKANPDFTTAKEREKS